MRHKAVIEIYHVLAIEYDILQHPLIDFSNLPDKYGKDNFVGLTTHNEIYNISWEDLIKCWDGKIRFYFDGRSYEKINDFTHVIVKDKFGYDYAYDYVTNFLNNEDL